VWLVVGLGGNDRPPRGGRSSPGLPCVSASAR